MGIVAFFDNTLNLEAVWIFLKNNSEIKFKQLLKRQRYKQMSEKHEVYFNVFYSECSISSRFISKIQTNEQKHEVYFNVFHSE